MSDITIRISYDPDTDTHIVEADDFDTGYGVDLLDAMEFFVYVNEDAWNTLQDRLSREKDLS